MTRVVIITHEPIAPLMAGPAIRALEMARALADSVEPTIATPYPVTRELPAGVSAATYAFGDERSLAKILADAETVIIQGFTLEKFPWLAEIDIPIVVDLYCPFQFENLERMRCVATESGDAEAAVTMDLEVLTAQLQRGDFFICASDRQRDMWLGMLYGVGRLGMDAYSADPTARDLIDAVPFGVPEDPPQRTKPTFRGDIEGIGPMDRLVVWGGSVLEWQDPMTVVDAIGQVALQDASVRFVLPGDDHPDPEVPPMPVLARLRKHAEQAGLLGRHVFFAPWIPYDERGSYLVEADIGVSAHRLTLETRFAWRTRMLDYVWASLPIVCTSGDSFGDIVASRGLGVAVPPGDSTAMANAMLELMRNPGLAVSCRTRLAELRNELGWRKAVEPLRRFLDHPTRRAYAPVGAGVSTSVRAKRWARWIARR